MSKERHKRSKRARIKLPPYRQKKNFSSAKHSWNIPIAIPFFVLISVLAKKSRWAIQKEEKLFLFRQECLNVINFNNLAIFQLLTLKMATDGKLRVASLHLMIIPTSLLMEQLNESFRGGKQYSMKDSFLLPFSSALLLNKKLVIDFHQFPRRLLLLLWIITIITFCRKYYLRLPHTRK